MRIFLLLAVLSIGNALSAQSISSQVVASGGGFLSNTTGSISFTIGQIMVAPLASTTLMLHQGFQVNVPPVAVITGLEEEPSDWKVYPNPVSERLFIEADQKIKVYEYQLIDVMGKSILTRDNVSHSVTLDVSQLAPAIYFLRLHDSQGKNKTISIIKSN